MARVARSECAPGQPRSNHERYATTVKLNTKTGVAAAAAATALAFPLAACGSNDDDASSGGLSTAAEASPLNSATELTESSAADAEHKDGETTAAGDVKGEKKDDKSKSKDKETKTSTTRVTKSGGGQDGGDAPTLANPFENGLPENTNEPLANGKPGSESDRKQMEDTARTVLNPDSFATWTRTILDNSCTAVREPMMDELERQGMTLDQVEEAGRLAEQQGQTLELPKTDVSLSDVRVDGDRASASLTAKTSDGEQTDTMIFQKEDGRWKLCN